MRDDAIFYRERSLWPEWVNVILWATMVAVIVGSDTPQRLEQWIRSTAGDELGQNA